MITLEIYETHVAVHAISQGVPAYMDFTFRMTNPLEMPPPAPILHPTSTSTHTQPHLTLPTSVYEKLSTWNFFCGLFHLSWRHSVGMHLQREAVVGTLQLRVLRLLPHSQRHVEVRAARMRCVCVCCSDVTVLLLLFYV